MRRGPRCEPQNVLVRALTRDGGLPADDRLATPAVPPSQGPIAEYPDSGLNRAQPALSVDGIGTGKIPLLLRPKGEVNQHYGKHPIWPSIPARFPPQAASPHDKYSQETPTPLGPARRCCCVGDIPYAGSQLTIPGLVVYRFYGPLLFANVRFFIERLTESRWRSRTPSSLCEKQPGTWGFTRQSPKALSIRNCPTLCPPSSVRSRFPASEACL
jgi:hypothetical protein